MMWTEFTTSEFVEKKHKRVLQVINLRFCNIFLQYKIMFAGSALSYEIELKSGENIYYIQMHILKYINTSSKSISIELVFWFFLTIIYSI